MNLRSRPNSSHKLYIEGIKKTTLRSNLMVKYKTDVDRSTQDKVGWEVKELGLDQVDRWTCACLSETMII